MTPHSRLAVVTASTNLGRARGCLESWHEHATLPLQVLVVENGVPEQPHLGTVPAFRRGVDQLLRESDAEVIACLHDDFEIQEAGWDEKVLRGFDRYPQVGLLGFGGAKGLGDEDLYQKDYEPMQLARRGFRSNLVDAEAHGLRSLLSERVACLDGFSQVGRRAFWEGFSFKQARLAPHLDRLAEELAAEWPQGFIGEGPAEAAKTFTLEANRPWTVLESLGFIHHFYDGALGCLAKRYGWQVYYVPLRARHYGGRTAVGDPGYQAWAQQYGGDHALWREAHRIGYGAFMDVLPIRT